MNDIPRSTSIGRTRNLGARTNRRKALSRLSLVQSISIAATLFFGGGIGLTGCGATHASVGPIAVTDANTPAGQLGSVSTSSKAAVSAVVAGDPLGAGIDWSVTCAGSPIPGAPLATACGQFAPKHTASGVSTIYTAPAFIPVNTNVLLTAAPTANPGNGSTLSLPISTTAVTIASTNVAPATLPVYGNAVLGAAVTNDPTGAGVMWSLSCGSTVPGACGTLFLTTGPSPSPNTFTAPASVPPGDASTPTEAAGTVKVTAASVTDPTKSISFFVQIRKMAITLASNAAYVQAGTSISITPTVTNDGSNLGVNPTCSSATPGACGTFLQATGVASGTAAMYMAPFGLSANATVTLSAVSTADTQTDANGGSIPITTASDPITVTEVPGPVVQVTITSPAPRPATINANATLAVSATVQNDQTAAGVDWSCLPAGACGSFTSSNTASGGTNTYTAPPTPPASGSATIIATAHSANIASPPIPANPDSFTLTVLPPLSVSVSGLPTAPISVSTQVADTVVPFTAAVTNDRTPGGVTFTLACGSAEPDGCGFIRPDPTSTNGTGFLYLAPPNVPPMTPPGASQQSAQGVITLTAISVADPTTSAPPQTLQIISSPSITVRFLPAAPAALTIGEQVNLAAAVVNDPTNAGVSWSVCASGCGFFTVRPALPATALRPVAVPAVTATTVPSWPNGLPIPYTAPASIPVGGNVAVNVAAVRSPNPAISASVAIQVNPSSTPLTGTVLSGTSPVAGASVTLYAAGTTGYGAASTVLSLSKGSIAATTDATGAFVVSGYACPLPSSLLYLVARSGKAGTGGTNPQRELVTALGPCSNVSAAPVIINEVTTVASLWPLAQFAGTNAAAIPDVSLLGSRAGNATTGFANAFAQVNNLVDIATGKALYRPSAENGTAPYAKINTLASALSGCSLSSGGVEGDGSVCSTLFTLTELPDPTSPSNALVFPVTVGQSALVIARNPAIDVVGGRITIGGLGNASPQFGPLLTAGAADWSLSLHYTSGGGIGAGKSTSGVNSLAIDGAGDLWIADATNGSVAELAPNGAGALGAPFTGGGVNAPAALAIDPFGDAWALNGNSTLSEFDFTGTAIGGSPFKGTSLTSGNGLAIDGIGNVWVTNGGQSGLVSEIAGSNIVAGGAANGADLGSQASGIANLTGGVAVDSNNGVWVTGQPTPFSSEIGELGAAGSPFSQYIGGGSQPISIFQAGPGNALLIDGANRIWNTPLVGGLSIAELIITPGPGLITSAFYSSTTYRVTEPGLSIDGSGKVWGLVSKGSVIGGSQNSAVVAFTASGNEVTLANQVDGLQTESAVPIQAGPVVDGSGGVWVLANDNSVTEFIGVATPVVTPVALGVKNKRLGARP